MNKKESVGLGERGSERKGGPEGKPRLEVCCSGKQLPPRAVDSSFWLERDIWTPLGMRPLEPLNQTTLPEPAQVLTWKMGLSQFLHATASGLGPPNKSNFPKCSLAGGRKPSAQRDAILLDL